MARPSRPRLLRRVAPALLVAAAGCSQLQLASAGPTACAPKEIEVRNVERSWKEESWEAVCKGVVYRCSQVATAWAVDVACTKVEADGPVRDEAAPPSDDGASAPPTDASSGPEAGDGEAGAEAEADAAADGSAPSSEPDDATDDDAAADAEGDGDGDGGSGEAGDASGGEGSGTGP